MATGFSRIAVIGPGLLGGSVALAARRAEPSLRVAIWARRSAAVDELRAMGIAHLATTDLAEAVAGSDLIVLATPVGAMPDLVARLVGLPLNEGTIVTDVGSVKGNLVRSVEAVLGAGRSISFVGSHPMAGSERTGIVHARADLFEDAMCVLTPSACATAGELARVRGFWAALGARTCVMEADAHDRAVAVISHLPHLVASALAVTSLGEDPSAAALAASGFRDTTRVAGGNPEMWAEIAMENREALREPLAAMAERLREMLAFLDNMEQEKLRRFLGRAKELRDGSFPRPVAPPPALG